MEKNNLSTQDVSVIICAYTEERWKDLVASINSVQQQSFPAKEIIVVIDHNPSLLAFAQEHISGAIVVENINTPGDSGVRNCGASIAQGDIIAFIDDDAIAAPDWLAWLIKGFENPQVLGVGGLIEPAWSHTRPNWFPEEFDWVVGCTYRGMPRTKTVVRNLIGANMSFRREVFAALGGFRDRLARVGTRPVGAHETELCIRATQRWSQGVFLYIPQAEVFHRVPNTRTRWRYFCKRCYYEGYSKATMTQFVSKRDGLDSERLYVLHTLPRGVLRNLSDVLFRRDVYGLARAGAIVIGLVTTVVGYFNGSLLSKFSRAS